MEQESLTDLIKSAVSMYSNIPRYESDIIYSIAEMDNDARTALVLAYKIVFEGKDDA